MPPPVLGCIFLQESSGFLCFPFLWHFFLRNHDSCSAVTFFLPPQKSCLYGAYVGSYVRLEKEQSKDLVRQVPSNQPPLTQWVRVSLTK
jgi:hypothetical protein